MEEQGQRKAVVNLFWPFCLPPALLKGQAFPYNELQAHLYARALNMPLCVVLFTHEELEVERI